MEQHEEIKIEICRMEREIILTCDGSHSISIPEMKVTYHSIHGAIQESMHVFIQAGLLGSGLFDYIGIHHVLEVGMGTGLNALLTLMEADKHKNRIYYTAIEPYPLDHTIIRKLNYCEQLNQPHYRLLFEKLHHGPWEEMFEISLYLRLTKRKCTFEDFSSEDLFSVVYLDAFAPKAQPELWSKEVFEKIYGLMLPAGILVTYCSKGEVRRAMQAAGFVVEKLPGPKGKREILRARKAFQ
jgi:tRNA U34 5-methylaminomethyl-2-thiouridine-forming methyltransferase MnmC